MDRWSTAAVASALGTTVPRIHRAVKALGVQPDAGRNGQTLTESQVERLRERLGSAPKIEGLTREQVFVLAALNCRPAGLRSARAVARDAGVSPTTAGKVLSALIARNLVRRDVRQLLEGEIVDGEVYTIHRGAEWRSIAERIRTAVVPHAGRRPPAPMRVPRRLWHHFWNGSPATVEFPRDENYVAARLLRSDDPQAVAWAATRMSAAAIAHVSRLRGVSNAERTFLRNLVRAAR